MKNKTTAQRFNLFIQTFGILAATVVLLSACATPDTSGMKTFKSQAFPPTDYQHKYYSVILLEVTDEPGYAEYRRISAPIFSGAGCHIEREISIKGEGIGPLAVKKTNRVIVTYCDTPNAFANLGKDDAFLKVKPLMMNSTTGFSFISGKSVYAGTSGSRTKDRLYLIKISDFNDKPHQAELQRLNPMLTPYGFHAENIINTTHAVGVGIKNPSEIAIFFFDQTTLQKELQKDKALMEEIKNFNKTYTNSFIYLAGMAM